MWLQGFTLYIQAKINVIQYRPSGTAWTELVDYQRFNLKVVLL